MEKLAVAPTSLIHILVAEDDPWIRHMIAEELRDQGAGVIEAGTGVEAWTYMVSGAPVDVLFTDHQMPGGLMGAVLASRVVDHFPGTKVVLTSGASVGPEWCGSILKKPYSVAETAQNLIDMAKQGGA